MGMFLCHPESPPGSPCLVHTLWHMASLKLKEVFGRSSGGFADCFMYANSVSCCHPVTCISPNAVSSVYPVLSFPRSISSSFNVGMVVSACAKNCPP